MRKAKVFLGLTLNFIIDYFLYIKHSGVFAKNSQEKLGSYITFLYHGIEKGLSMSVLRYGFGRSKVIALLTCAVHYLKKGYSTENSQFIAACSVLIEYYNIHKGENYSISHYFNEEQYELLKKYAILKSGGVKSILKKDYFSKTNSSFPYFVQSRHSVRSFSDQLVPTELISNAIELAKYCPSACNRQTSKVYLIDKKETVDKILLIQKGVESTAKFIHQILVVTANRNSFFTSGERNQHFVDGGIFLESLLLSLHYEKIAACPLHWSLNYSHDKKINNLVCIGQGEKVIALVAIGYLKEDLKIPVSQRKYVSEIFVEHKS